MLGLSRSLPDEFRELAEKNLCTSQSTQPMSAFGGKAAKRRETGKE
jgi:hypothetical protein